MKAAKWLALLLLRGLVHFVECGDMIKLVRIPLLYGTLIFSMTGVASAQSVPFYPTARQTYYDVGIPGTYDHITASVRPEYNLNREQQPRHSAGHKEEDGSARVRFAVLLSRLWIHR